MQAATLSCLCEERVAGTKKYSYKMYYVMAVQSSLRFILSAIKVSDYGMHWELGTSQQRCCQHIDQMLTAQGPSCVSGFARLGRSF